MRCIKTADIPVSQISDYTSRSGALVWVALQDATPAGLEEMQHEFGLHELVGEDKQHAPPVSQNWSVMRVAVRQVWRTQ